MARQRRTPPRKASSTAAPAPAYMREAQAFQEHIWSEYSQFWHKWLERRQQAVRSLAGLPGGFAQPQAVAAWQAGALDCLAQDIKDWTALCGNCAGYWVKSEEAAAALLMDEAKTMQELAAPARHATPV